MLSAKAHLALGAAVIAGVFVALMIKSRGPTQEQLDRDQLMKFGDQQSERERTKDRCNTVVPKAVEAARDFLVARYGDTGPEEIGEIVAHRCAVDVWPDEVLSCLDRVTTDNEMQRCIGRLDDNARRAIEAEMRAFESRPRRDVDAGVDAEDDDGSNDIDVDFGANPFDDDAAVGVGSSDLPEECVDYMTEMVKIYSCDKFPQASKDAMKQAMDSMKQGWANLRNVPDAAKRAVADGCKQGADALKQAMAAVGC